MKIVLAKKANPISIKNINNPSMQYKLFGSLIILKAASTYNNGLHRIWENFQESWDSWKVPSLNDKTFRGALIRCNIPSNEPWQSSTLVASFSLRNCKVRELTEAVKSRSEGGVIFLFITIHGKRNPAKSAQTLTYYTNKKQRKTEVEAHNLGVTSLPLDSHKSAIESYIGNRHPTSTRSV